MLGFLKRFILTRWMFTRSHPKCCLKCGTSYVKIRMEDLSSESREKYRKQGTLRFIEKYAYRCPNCHLEDEIVYLS